MNAQVDGAGAVVGLVCPECGEPALEVAPTGLAPEFLPVPAWSHRDGEPLCPVMTAGGYRPALPVPVEQADAVAADHDLAVGRDPAGLVEFSAQAEDAWDDGWEAGS